eukprot:scaffold40431_cov77-Phaeocystis_antarctica.AAC.3
MAYNFDYKCGTNKLPRRLCIAAIYCYNNPTGYNRYSVASSERASSERGPPLEASWGSRFQRQSLRHVVVVVVDLRHLGHCARRRALTKG